MKRPDFFLIASVVILLASAGLQAQQSAPQKVEGILSIVWGDPHPQRGSGGKTLYLGAP